MSGRAVLVYNSLVQSLACVNAKNICVWFCLLNFHLGAGAHLFGMPAWRDPRPQRPAGYTADT